ncbi:hypothetical protein J3F84DRAFT_104537 [Trichoderma pleuroticola]
MKRYGHWKKTGIGLPSASLAGSELNKDSHTSLQSQLRYFVNYLRNSPTPIFQIERILLNPNPLLPQALCPEIVQSTDGEIVLCGFPLHELSRPPLKSDTLTKAAKKSNAAPYQACRPCSSGAS